MDDLLKQCRDALIEAKYFFDDDFPDGSNGPCAVTSRYRAAFKSIEALLPKLDAALAQPQLRMCNDDWKTIESAPKNGIPFDAWAISGPGDSGFRVANCWTDESGVRIPAGTMFSPFCTITHWRPLPSSPSEPKEIYSEPEAEEVTIRIQRRIDGGIRVWSEDVRGLILSGNDPVEVMADVWPALMVLLNYSSPSEPKEDKSR